MASRKKKGGVGFRYDVGTKVERYFEAHGWFSGRVEERWRHEDNDGDAMLYRVRYEDDDQEDLDERDLAKYVVVEGSEITPAKRRKIASATKTTTTNARGVTPSPVASAKPEGSEEDDDTPSTSGGSSSNSKEAAAPKNRKRKSAAAPAATASKHFSKKSSISIDSSSQEEEEEDDEEEDYSDNENDDDDEQEDDVWDVPLARLKKKSGASLTKLPPKNKNPPAEKKTRRDDTNPASSKKGGTKPAAKKKNLVKKDAAPKKKGAGTTKAPAKTKTVPGNPPPANAGPPLIMAEDSDSDDERDRPFRVEYAPSSRSTCRSCDERIEKGAVRIGSSPLFRGQPGFVVYRHLQCQILPEEIQSMKDVGGWRRLRAEDRELLASQVELSKSEIERENEELHADELVQTKFQGELRPAPPGLSATLLPFQHEGVSWMYDQEVNTEMVKGGILADEMGMGKTLQTITCILDNRPKLQHAKPGVKHPPSSPDLEALKREEALWDQVLEDCHHDLKMADVPESILKVKKKKGAAPVGVRAGTLVVVPVIAIYQWQEEIKKFTDENALSVCIYHGSDRQSKFPREMLCKYDIILTTYQVLESDFRKMISPNKVTCPNCGRKFKIDKLPVHLKYFCGETAQRTEKQARQRRTAERHQRPAQNNRRGGVPGKGGKGGTKKAFQPKQTKQASKTKVTPPKTAAKKTVRASSNKDYDTDSDLSFPDDLDVSSRRPSRSAATLAKKKMSKTSNDWAEDAESDSDAFSQSEDSSDEESSEDDFVAPTKTAVARRNLSKKGKNTSDDRGGGSGDDSDSSDDELLARARKRQKIALSQIKQNNKKAESGKKKFTSAKKSKPSTSKKGSGKKKFDDDDDTSDSDVDSDDHDDIDPLALIDMEALKAEALEGCAVSVLHTMCFWRIVLDEAHMIKSRSSQTASAAFHLSSVHRWALSGTPLQNRVGELYSLIRFLRLDPMAHYFCRRDCCDCKSIYYRMEHGKCKDCGHASSQHFSHFNKHILNVIQREGYTGDGRRAMMKLKAEVLDKVLLRRTKESRAEDMNLPPRVVTIKAIRLHPREEDFYNGLYTQSKSSFDDYVAEGSILNNYAHVFDLLTKMRQAVDHPYLIVHSKKAHSTNTLTGGQQNGPAVANGSTVCEICEETPTDRVVSSCCGSAFCRSCVLDMMSLEDMQQDNGLRCISCRRPFSIDLNQAQQQIVDDSTLTVSSSISKVGMPSLREMSHVASGSILRRINLAEFATSTKVEALVQELVQMRQERQGSKALVFSQFVNMLDLVRWRLHSDPCLEDLGLGVRIIHGGMNVQSRDEALKAFREDPSVRVLLMSLKAGGVALNLTVANEAYLLDPWWNPAAEMQAIDRTHRLGQYRPIRALRFIAEGTVEERVLQLQEKKRLVFDGTVGRDAASLKMLTVDDMKALFT